MLTGLVLLFSITALAHDPGLSAADIRILPNQIVAEVSFAPRDLQQLQHLGSNDYIAAHLLTIKSDQEILKLRNFSVQTSDANSIHFILEFPNQPGDELRLSAIALAHLPRGLQRLAHLRAHRRRPHTCLMIRARDVAVACLELLRTSYETARPSLP